MTKGSLVMVFQLQLKVLYMHTHVHESHKQTCDSSLVMMKVLCILIIQTNSVIDLPRSICCALSREQILAQKSCTIELI